MQIKLYMTDNKELEIIKKLKECGKSAYYIAKKTGLSNSSIANWLNGKTSPNPANIAILEHFFEMEDSKGSQEPGGEDQEPGGEDQEPGGEDRQAARHHCQEIITIKINTV